MRSTVLSVQPRVFSSPRWGEGPKRESHSAKGAAERAFDLLNELVDVLKNADPRKQKEFIRRCVQKVVLDFVRVPQGRRHVNQLAGGHISYYQLGDTLALGEFDPQEEGRNQRPSEVLVRESNDSPS